MRDNYSQHHKNTRKVLEAMAQEGNIDLFDVVKHPYTQLEKYDCIGFASCLYAFTFHQSILAFAKQYLPSGKPVFFVYTYGLSAGTGAKALMQIAQGKDCPVLGEFGCKGYDTFGPFKLVGGIAKGHPDQSDLDAACNFYRKICKRG